MNRKKIDSKSLHRTRRNLPHWQIGGSWYFITFRTKNEFKLTAQSRDIVLKTIRYDHKKHYLLSIVTVMPDHVHVILKPLMKEGESYFSLEEILKPVKGISARRINLLYGTGGAVWMDESYDRIIRNDEEWDQKHYYIYNNAVSAGLVENPENYKWLIRLKV